MVRDSNQPLPQQKFYKPLPFPGTSAFHLASGMSQRPEREVNTSKSRRKNPKTASYRVNRETNANNDAAVQKPCPSRPETRVDIPDFPHLTPRSISTPWDSISAASPRVWSAVATAASTTLCNTPPDIVHRDEWIDEEVSGLPLWPDTEYCAMPELMGVGAVFEGLGIREHELELELDDYRCSTVDTQDDLKWNKILATNMSLLEQYHKLFTISEKPDAPEGLKYLVAVFQIPSRMWTKGFHQTLEVLREKLPQTAAEMQMMARLACETLERLCQSAPSMSMHWELIRWNLREYFRALQSDGIDLDLNLDDDDDVELKTIGSIDPTQELFEQKYHEELAKESPRFEWLFQEHLHSVLENGVLGCKESLASYRITGTAQLLMEGCLYYSRIIPRHTFHSFCQVFIFLGLTGAGVFNFQS